MESPKHTSSRDEYLSLLDDDRKEIMLRLENTIRAALPEGFAEDFNYGMISFVVPKSLYPAGYHCDPALPLPFMAIASQKSFIALYHMGLYADPALMAWFQGELQRQGVKIDMGKSCVRFNPKKPLPYATIAALSGKMSARDWIASYEASRNKA
ncbi:MAG TPA: hypothetical protein DCG47_04100 [Spirochaetaceae bacterium]|jgi:uncharacterized protein YdhG (YjbR/CyaY superfamily)|nr:hypothetical protein [Spirochaetaceae bacterium]